MTEFMMAAAVFVLAMVALGLGRILYGPAKADRLMGAQLLGSGGIAALLLFGSASQEPAVLDVALVLALLATFASVAFVVSGSPSAASGPEQRTADESSQR